MELRYGMMGIFFSPPLSPTFPEKYFRCPFQYQKVPLEAGAPPNILMLPRPLRSEMYQTELTKLSTMFKRLFLFGYRVDVNIEVYNHTLG